MVQVQPRKHALDHAGCTAPTWQHELDQTHQGPICPSNNYLDHRVGINYLLEVYAYYLKPLCRATCRASFTFGALSCVYYYGGP